MELSHLRHDNLCRKWWGTRFGWGTRLAVGLVAVDYELWVGAAA